MDRQIFCPRLHIFLYCTAFFFGGVILGYEYKSTPSHDPVATPRESFEVREAGRYSYINPLLECEMSDGAINASKIDFRSDLIKFIDQKISTNNISDIGVYFRDLNNGPSFGINANAPFIPASLLKLPVMMAYFAYADDVPEILNKEIILSERQASPDGGRQIILPENEIEVGKKYTVRELLEHMIIYSDNQALSLLIANIPPRYIRDLYATLGVSQDVLNGPDGRLTVREYASFFRILFNASYLSRERSENALSLLVQTKFNSGLVAGVPEHMKVAHKFGEGGYEDDHQIHDCGIVYYPMHPYLLCVMTRGKDIGSLEQAIAGVSRYVYDQTNRQYAPGAK